MTTATATTRNNNSPRDWNGLANKIRDWGRALGFDEIGIAGTDLGDDEARLVAWLAAAATARWIIWHATACAARVRPSSFRARSTVITARLNYLPPAARASDSVLADPAKAFVARYALGRDYHKVLRAKLERLAGKIRNDAGAFGYRVFTDSAPVLEVALAAKSGLGWRGKHTLLLTRDAGSWFFLGEIYTSLPLPETPPQTAHCGSCTACIDICPTHAIVGPYELDARRCISYLTIEHVGSIPEDLRPLIGNRIYGCDDCQLVCPWNRYATISSEADFTVRNGLDDRRPRDALRVERERVSRTNGGQRNPPDRLRALVAQHRGCARQRATRTRHRRRADGARRRSVAAGSRACGVGARAAS